MMTPNYFVLTSCLFTVAGFSFTRLTRNVDPESRMSMPEVVAYHGYPFEEYEVKSEDGFYTWIQRIPYGKNNTNRANRKPVIIQHGQSGLSSVWVVNVPWMNLAYILAEEGYDVWLANSRGNAYSLHHEKYTTDQPEFWFHDWHEMGYYDMPAFIDFVLAKTGFSQLLYIGHSMGTTIGFVMLSDRPEYNQKVKAAFMLAPVMTVNHIKGVLTFFNGHIRTVEYVQRLGLYSINPSSPLLQWTLQKTCNMQDDLLCKLQLLIFRGRDALRLNRTRAPVFVHLTPSSSPTQTYLHYGQVMEAGKFQHYDYGRSRNLELYNQLTPSEYNLAAITTPIYLYSSDGDTLATSEDIAEMVPKLKSLKKHYHVPNPLFTHIEFVWGLDVKRLVYDQLIDDMKSEWP